MKTYDTLKFWDQLKKSVTEKQYRMARKVAEHEAEDLSKIGKQP